MAFVNDVKPLMRSLLRRPPLLSIVLIAFNMKRELRNTLRSLSACYQQHVSRSAYEVIVVDNGSLPELDPSLLDECEGVKCQWLRCPPGKVSPCFAVNLGVAKARAKYVCVMVDGARMLSPGVVVNMIRAQKLFPNCFVTTLGWHLGDEPQNISMLNGYNQEVEDSLLASFDWQSNGYQLFSHSCLALSCSEGWFSGINESNCFSLSKQSFFDMGGFDQRFQSPGGGIVNLDFFRTVVESAKFVPVMLLGEGSFHQFHGGVATNVPMKAHPWSVFHDEYRSIRGCDYQTPPFQPFFLGSLPSESRVFLS